MSGKLFIFIISVSVIAFITGCSPVYYAPDVQHVPLHKEAGEIRLSGGFSQGADVTYTDFQGSIAILDNIAVMSSAMYADYGEHEDKAFSECSGEGHQLSLGMGYFRSFGLLIFETYAGMGLGRVKNYHEYQGFSDMKYTQPFIQPSVGVKINHIELAFSIRFNHLDYYNIKTRDLDIENQKKIDTIEKSGEYWFWEPALTARLGFPNIKLQAQIRTSENFNRNFDYRESIMISLGVIFEFDLSKL